MTSDPSDRGSDFLHALFLANYFILHLDSGLLQQKADTKCLNIFFGYRSLVGMSRGHGAIQLRSPEMGDQKLPNQSTDDGTVTSRRVGIQRHRNKQNLDYVLRSGLCGGLAGCAVCTHLIIARLVYVNQRFL